MVLLFPSLMVPPMSPGLCSGISITWQSCDIQYHHTVYRCTHHSPVCHTHMYTAQHYMLHVTMVTHHWVFCIGVEFCRVWICVDGGGGGGGGGGGIRGGGGGGGVTPTSCWSHTPLTCPSNDSSGKLDHSYLHTQTHTWSNGGQTKHIHVHSIHTCTCTSELNTYDIVQSRENSTWPLSLSAQI